MNWSGIKERLHTNRLSLFPVLIQCVCSLCYSLSVFYHVDSIDIAMTRNELSSNTRLDYDGRYSLLERTFCGRKHRKARGRQKEGKRKRKCKSNPFLHFSSQDETVMHTRFCLFHPRFKRERLRKRLGRVRRETWQMINEQLIVNEDWWHAWKTREGSRDEGVKGVAECIVWIHRSEGFSSEGRLLQ